MKLSNIKLIYLRELRDQLRDRRTLFTIAVLPLLLYPLLGMSLVQVAQFMQEHPTRIWIIGAEGLPSTPALIEENQFAGEFCLPNEALLLQLVIDEKLPAEVHAKVGQIMTEKSLDWERASLHVLDGTAQQAIQAGKVDAVVYFPPDFSVKLERIRQHLGDRDRQPEEGPLALDAIPQPVVFANTAADKSRIAKSRVGDVLARWTKRITQHNLEAVHVPVAATQPLELVEVDVAEDSNLRAAVWSKVLPFVVLIWALTGAFYPAVDLCAGEKERGTLETLLSSPAQRNEIVWGKLLTIMSFSIATSLLNLASMGITGFFLIQQLAGNQGFASQLQLGPPPIASMGWLVVALIPISALFSALSLAVAAFARSSKEGQYYLMPLLLISLPLMMLPMLPGVELNLGTSVIPVTGMILLLRKLIEGQYWDALHFSIPVIAVTSLCCWLAGRWAVNQFNNESVLFRESERWDVGLWFRHLVRDRGNTPTFSEALMCGVVLLLIRFFAGLYMPPPADWSDLAISTLAMQIGLIATPAVLMAVMLTRSPVRTLKLRMPKLFVLPAAMLLAVMFHPLYVLLAEGVQLLYPVADATKMQLKSLEGLIGGAPNFWCVLALFALVPAICEELAFRGFILSGLQSSGRKWMPIIVSSVFFGVTHFLLQQSLTACIVGVVIGYIVVQSRSLLAGILFHVTSNSLSFTITQFDPAQIERHPVLRHLFRTVGDGFIYHWSVVAIGGASTLALLWWFRGLTRETATRDNHVQTFKPASANSLSE